MSWIRFIGLSCSRTQESEDEIYMHYTWDWHPMSHSRVLVLRERTMDVGDGVALTYTAEFEHAAVVTLWESDRTNPDDFIGHVMVTPEFEGTGEHTFTVERPGLGSYELTLEVTRDRPGTPTALLRLLSLHCSDAQERTDEPVVLVNGHELWSGSMRTRDTQTLDVLYALAGEARIELFERDRTRSDLIGTHTVDRSVRGAGPQTLTFSRDRGIVGDATYRLVYQVE